MKNVTFLAILLLCLAIQSAFAMPDSLITVPNNDCAIVPSISPAPPCLEPAAPQDSIGGIGGPICCCYGITLHNNGAEPFCSMTAYYNEEDTICGVCNFSLFGEQNWYAVKEPDAFTIKTDKYQNWLRSNDFLEFTICGYQRPGIHTGFYTFDMVNCDNNQPCHIVTRAISITENCSYLGQSTVPTVQPNVYISNAHPNPSINYLYFDCYQAEPSSMILHLMDMSGRILETKEVAIGGGVVSIKIATSELPTGNYLMSFSAPTFQKTRSFSVAH